MGDVIVSYALQDEAAALDVVSQLAKAGYQVDAGPTPSGRSALARRAADSAGVVLLWSRHARRDGALLKQAAAAKAAGKLVAAQLEALPRPTALRDTPMIDLSGARIRAAHAALSPLLLGAPAEKAPAPPMIEPAPTPAPLLSTPAVEAPPPAKPRKGGAIALTALLVALALAAAAAFVYTLS